MPVSIHRNVLSQTVGVIPYFLEYKLGLKYKPGLEHRPGSNVVVLIEAGP